MNKPELVYNLQVTFKARVTSLCDNAGELTEQEATELLGKTLIGCVLQAFTSLNSWLKGCSKKPHRITIMRKLAVFIDRENNKAVTSGHVPKFLPKDAPQTVPVAAPIKAVPEPSLEAEEKKVDTLRLSFQNNATFGAWTLSCEDIAVLRQSYKDELLIDAFSAIGRYDDDEHSQQDCFNKLSKYLDKMAWQEATADCHSITAHQTF